MVKTTCLADTLQGEKKRAAAARPEATRAGAQWLQPPARITVKAHTHLRPRRTPLTVACGNFSVCSTILQYASCESAYAQDIACNPFAQRDKWSPCFFPATAWVAGWVGFFWSIQYMKLTDKCRGLRGRPRAAAVFRIPVLLMV